MGTSPAGMRPARTARSGGGAATPWLTSPRLVGRDRELQQLLDLLEHRPAIAVIEGDAGVGKSRLAQELLERAPTTLRRLVGRAHRMRDPFPLGPLADAFRGLDDDVPSASDAPSLLGALVPLVPELADRLPAPLPPTSEPHIARHLLFRAARLLLERLGPTVCVLEDLHWSDEATLEFLRFLTPQLPANVLLVLTCRSEEPAAAAALRDLASQRVRSRTGFALLELSPLRRADMTALLGALLDTNDISEQFAAYLHERTAGLPLAVEEVVRLMYERGLLVRGGNRWFRQSLERLGVPLSINDAVQQRLDTLALPGHRLAEAAAVLDMAAEPVLLWAVAGLPPDEGLDALRQVLRSGLLIPGPSGRYGFRHELAAEAVREAIPEPERSRLHRLAAEALEQMTHPPVGRLVHHYRRAGLPQWQRHAEAAADLAMAQGDPAEAARLLQQLLAEAALTRRDRVRVAAKFGRAALYGLATPDEAISLLRSAVEEPEFDDDERGEIRSYLALLLGVREETELAMAECARAVGELRGSPAKACELLIEVVSWWSLPPDVREQWGDRAVEIATQLGDARLEHRARATRLVVRLHLGDTAAWEELTAVAHQPGDSTMSDEDAAWNACRLCAAAYFLGEYGRALTYLGEELRHAEAAGYEAFEPIAETDTLLLKWATGDWDGLEARAARHAEVMADRPMSSVPGRLVHAFFALIRGSLDDAERRYAETAEIARTAGIVPAHAAALKGLARAHMHRGERDEACVAAMEGVHALIKTGYWIWVSDVVTVAVEALLRAGRRQDAIAVFHEFETQLAGSTAPVARAAMHLCRGLLAHAHARYREADAELLAAERLYQQFPSPYEASHAAAARGLCALDAGDPAAEGLLRDACERFLAMGAKLDAAQLRRARRAVTETTPGRRGRKGYGVALSPREEAVVALASRGLTNKEIAAQLFLSANTVAHHVSAAMEKLGARTRMALAERWKHGHAAQ